MLLISAIRNCYSLGRFGFQVNNLKPNVLQNYHLLNSISSFSKETMRKFSCSVKSNDPLVLFNYIREGNVAALEEALKLNPCLNIVDQRGKTLLQAALEKRCTASVRSLLLHQAPLNQQSTSGITSKVPSVEVGLNQVYVHEAIKGEYSTPETAHAWASPDNFATRIYYSSENGGVMVAEPSGSQACIERWGVIPGGDNQYYRLGFLYNKNFINPDNVPFQWSPAICYLDLQGNYPPPFVMPPPNTAERDWQNAYNPYLIPFGNPTGGNRFGFRLYWWSLNPAQKAPALTLKYHAATAVGDHPFYAIPQ